MEHYNRSNFLVESVPNAQIDIAGILQAIGGRTFCLIHDFLERRTYIEFYCDDADQSTTIIKKIVPGISLSHADVITIGEMRTKVLCLYKQPSGTSFFSESFSYLSSSKLFVFFIPVDQIALHLRKTEIGKLLSKVEEKGTSSVAGSVFSKQISTSLHTGNYNGREEVEILRTILESLENSIMNGLPAYKVYACFDSREKSILNYVSSNYAIISSFEFDSRGDDALLHELEKFNSLPFGLQYSKNFISFPVSQIKYVAKTAPPATSGRILLGEYVSNGAFPTGVAVHTEASALNLGLIVTGMPGTGKTSAVMNILESVSRNSDARIIIISPTREWRKFGELVKADVIDLNNPSLRMNLFGCPDGCSVSKFYENLAMVLSHASAAGPYQKPLEKCLLDAFEGFKDTNNPDPLEVYNAIEDSVIRLHGKRTNTGVKYTKHGENIHSAVEDLRLVLRRTQFRSRAGVDVYNSPNRNIIFDISSYGSLAMSYLYAVILNQIYSIADSMDEIGEDKLRLVVCLEEAQLIFGERSKENDAALRDIKNRIQDFRKKGIGLVLITHNVSDINSGVRSMCQTKAYFKQAPSEADKAASDLVFSFSEKESIITMLTHLEKRVFALNYVLKQEGNMITPDSIFVRSLDSSFSRVSKHADSSVPFKAVSEEQLIECSISLAFDPDNTAKHKGAEDQIIPVIVDFGIEIKCARQIGNSYAVRLYKLQRYWLSLRNRKGVELYGSYILAAKQVTARLGQSGMEIIY